MQCSSRDRDNFGTAFRVGQKSFLTAGHNALRRVEPVAAFEKRDLQLILPPEGRTDARLISALWQDQGGIDFAILQAELPNDWPVAYIPTQERLPKIGEEVAALGFPYIASRHPTLVLHVGRVEAVTRGYRDARFVTVSFAAGPGVSGSPVLDANGYCVGVMVENTFMSTEDPPQRAYGQAIAIGHWRELPECGPRLTQAAG